MSWSNRLHPIVLLLLAVALFIMDTRGARAAIWVEFHPSSAAAGESVEVRGYGLPASSSVEVFLAPKAVADSITTPDGSKLIPLGSLTSDGANEATLTFVVPNVSPGPYIGLIHCASCALYSAGRIMLPGDDFRVTAPWWQTVGMVITVGVMLLSGLGLWRRRPRRLCSRDDP